MEDVGQTIISQYSYAPTLRQLIFNLDTYIDPSADIDQFYDLIMNVDTAVGYGLDNWGRIVGVGRVLTVASGDYLGFDEASDPSLTPFGQAPWYLSGPVTSNFALSDEGYRLLILAKAAANITDCSIGAINAILLMLFPDRGSCYVTDGLDMSMTYTFEFPLTPVEISIVTNSGVLPRPVGVSATVVII